MLTMHTALLASLILSFCTRIQSSAIPAEALQKSRVIDRALSDEEHFSDDDTNESPQHNLEFDHEAFLGKDEQKIFQDLTPDESKERLGLIYLKIDKDQDGTLTLEELTDWIRHVQLRYVTRDTDRQWKDYDADGTLVHFKWSAYMERTYGHKDEDIENLEKEHYGDMIRRDRRRWATADLDNDGMLTKEEFVDFLHPEQAERMKDIVIDETLEDIDKDKDGSISLEEYIGDMYSNRDESDEPQWVKSEREQFSLFRDKNKDGVMDRDEVMDWILPNDSDYDQAEAEAKHLIFESDVDKDAVLSKDEVLEKFDLFVGSQATDFGVALKEHDEF